MSNKPPRKSRSLWLGFAFVIVAVGSCCFYPILKSQSAQQEIHAFCGAVQVGEPIDGVRKRAEEQGFQTTESKASEARGASFTAFDGWAFNRFFCEVEHDATGVLSKNTFALD